MNEPSRNPTTLPPDLILSLHHVDHWRHIVRLILFVMIYLGSAGIAVQLSQRVDHSLQWLLLIPLYLLAAASLHGISLFTHEAVHGTLCQNRLLNDLCGAICAFPVLQTCRAYRVLHLKHHSHLGDAGDPDHYENYTRWTWMVFIMNWLRLLIGYPVYITAIPILGFRQGNRQDRSWIITEVVTLLGLIVLIVMSGASTAWIIHGWLIPMLLINTMVNIRGMSQHTLLEHASDPIQGTRTILTIPLVRFFMCNENYHLEHHLYPGIPWHSLPQVHKSLNAALSAAGAPYIRSYAAFVREFLIHSIKRSPLGRKAEHEAK
jgi:fatty acid desaturase